MLACCRATLTFASSMNMSTNSWFADRCDRIRLMTTRCSKPPSPNVLALKISAIPPVAMRSTRKYFPKIWAEKLNRPPPVDPPGKGEILPCGIPGGIRCFHAGPVGFELLAFPLAADVAATAELAADRAVVLALLASLRLAARLQLRVGHGVAALARVARHHVADLLAA